MMNKMNGKKKKIVGAAIALLVITGGYGYYQHTETIAAERAATLRLSGNVDVRESTLAFRQSDRITEILVEEGDAVTAGQILAKLDSRDLEIRMEKTRALIAAQENTVQRLRNGNRPEEIARAAASAEAAQAEAEDARQNLAKKQEAYESSGGRSVSRDTVDTASAAYSARMAKADEANAQYRLMQAGARTEDIGEAEAQLQALREELAQQEYLLEQYVLRAPSNGVIRSRLMEVGDMASPPQPLFKLSLDTKKWVRAYVSEAELGRVYEGQSAEVYIDSFPDRPITGQIGYISGTAEFTPKTVQTDDLRTALLYEIRIYVNDEANVLRMGMPATVKVDG